jgi:hypothetical protein
VVMLRGDSMGDPYDFAANSALEISSRISSLRGVASRRKWPRPMETEGGVSINGAALLFELCPEAIRQPRRPILIRQVTPRAWSAGATAGASVVAFPWSARVSFTHPAAVLAE